MSPNTNTALNNANLHSASSSRAQSPSTSRPASRPPSTPSSSSHFFSGGVGARVPFGLSPDTNAATGIGTGPLGTGLGFGFGFGASWNSSTSSVQVGFKNDTQDFDVEPYPASAAPALSASRPRSRSRSHSRPGSPSSLHDDAGDGEGDMSILSDQEMDDFLPDDYPLSRLSLSASTAAPAASRPPPPPGPVAVKPEFNPDTLLTFPSTETAHSVNPDPDPDHGFEANKHDIHSVGLTKDAVLSSPSPPPPPLPHSHLQVAPTPTSVLAPTTEPLAPAALSPAEASHSDPPSVTVTVSSFCEHITSSPHSQCNTSKSASLSFPPGQPTARSGSKESFLPQSPKANSDMLYDTPLLDYMDDANCTQMLLSSPIASEPKPDKFLVLDTSRFPLLSGYNILGTKPKHINNPRFETKYPQHMVALPSHLNGLSRIHAIIHVRKDGRVFIHDYQSKNGTYLDPLPSDPGKVRHLTPYVADLVNPGDHIRLASHSFTLESTATPPPPPAPLPAPVRVMTRRPTLPAASALGAPEPTPPGSLTPTPASVSRSYSSSSSASSAASASAGQAVAASSPSQQVGDTSTAAQHGSMLQSAVSPAARVQPAAGSVPGALERLRSTSMDDPEVEAFLRDLPPIMRFERKSSGGLAVGTSSRPAIEAGSGPFVLSSQAQRVLVPSSSQVNVNGYGLNDEDNEDDDEDFGGGGFRSPGLSPISRASLSVPRSPHHQACDNADDEGDVDLVRPSSAGRPSSGFGFKLFSTTPARAQSTTSPSGLLPPSSNNKGDESLDLMDVDAGQESCVTTVSRLRIHDRYSSSSVSPFSSSPFKPKRTSTGDSAVERTALSPPPAAHMHLPPPPQLAPALPSSSSSSSSSWSSAALRRKPAQPKRHSSFSVSSPEPMDKYTGSTSKAAAETGAAISGMPKQQPAKEPLPQAKRSKLAALAPAGHVRVEVPRAPAVSTKRKRRGSIVAPAAAGDVSSTDDGPDTHGLSTDPSPPLMKRARTLSSDVTAVAPQDHSGATPRARPERKAKVTARCTAGEQAAIEARFHANLKVELRKKSRATGQGRRLSGAGCQQQQEGHEESGSEEDRMDVDVVPQTNQEAKRKTETKRPVSDGWKPAVELHVDTNASDSEDGMDVDKEPEGNTSKKAAAKKASGKRKAKAMMKPEVLVPSTPSASRRCSGSKSAVKPDPDGPTYTVLFTGGSKAAHDADRSLVTKLAGQTTDKWQEANVLVVDKVRRTVKFLCSLASGIDIVSPAWLVASKKAKRLLPTDGYALVDREMEAKFGFVLSESVERRTALMESGERVFSGLRFFVCSGTVPALHDMKEIISAAAGTLVHSIPSTRAKSKDAAEQGLVVIAGDGIADADQRNRLWDLGYVLHTAEFVLSGVLRQQPDWELHQVRQVKEEDAPAASLATGRTTRRGKKSG